MGIATHKFRLLNASAFVESFSETSPTVYHFFIGRNQLWPDEGNPPTESDTISSVNVNVFDEMMAMKRVSAGDASFAARRFDWAANTVFTEYNPAVNLANSNFYVLTDQFNVYKCLFNNNNANSTVKPTGTSANNDIITGDGYMWKFMFSISGPDASKFLTSSHMPVKTLPSDDGSLQWQVQTNAANSAIHNYDVVSAGSGYVAVANGTIANTVNTTSVSLAAGASSNNNFYSNSAIYIVSGSGAGQVRKISSYAGVTRRIGVTAPFSPMIDGTSTYYVSPSVNITGDGTGASAYTMVSNTNSIASIVPITRGANYSRANLTIEAGAGLGSGATGTPLIAPIGGHGSNPIEELYAFNAVVNVTLAGNESNTFTTRNEYRTVGIVSDSLLASNGAVATNSVYDLTTRLGITSHTGVFQNDEVITGQTSGATARVVEFVGNTSMRINNVVGTFANTESITGSSTLFTGNINSITNPLIRRYSGEVVYYENRPPISRNEQQTEFLKLIVKF